MARWSGLQGFTPTKYRRYVKKSEWELKFTREGFFYRPWYEISDISNGGQITYEFERVPDDSGEEQHVFKAPELSMDDAVSSKAIATGDPKYQGFFYLKPFICGTIEKVQTVEDDRTGIRLSSSNGNDATPHETLLVVKADKKQKVKRNLYRLGVDEVEIEKGREYHYLLRGLFPSEWHLWGPFDPEKRTATFSNAVLMQMQKDAAEFARLAMEGGHPLQEGEESDAFDNSIDL
jgi:hypothetical protein